MTEPLDLPSSAGTLVDFNGASTSLDSTPLKARNLRISLKQWKMFHAVIECGGFFGAADSLHVTQSTVSHAVAKLQEQLGIPLLVLKGRKAHITEQGKALLERSRDLVRSAMELEELAENLKHGWGPEIRLALDPSFPHELLPLALRKLSSFPQKIRLTVKEASPDQVRQALHDHAVELAISSHIPFGFTGKRLIDIDHVAVAHPLNPLFALKRDLSSDDLKSQFQIVITGINDYIASETHHRLPLSQRPWNVSSLDRAIAAMRYGVGYAWLPKYQTERWIADHQLRILPLGTGSSYRTSLYLIPVRPIAASSAAAAFADELHACSARFA